jgi:hypothetical protein
MKFTARASYSYAPQFGGNRDLPEKERISVEIIRPRIEERDALFRLDFTQEGGSGSGDMAMKQQSDVGRALRKHVGEIKNLVAVYTGGIEKPILTGKDLAEAPLFGAGGLVTELFLEIISDALREDEKKTSASPSS